MIWGENPLFSETSISTGDRRISGCHQQYVNPNDPEGGVLYPAQRFVGISYEAWHLFCDGENTPINWHSNGKSTSKNVKFSIAVFVPRRLFFCERGVSHWPWFQAMWKWTTNGSVLLLKTNSQIATSWMRPGNPTWSIMTWCDKIGGWRLLFPLEGAGES